MENKSHLQEFVALAEAFPNLHSMVSNCAYINPIVYYWVSLNSQLEGCYFDSNVLYASSFRICSPIYNQELMVVVSSLELILLR